MQKMKTIDLEYKWPLSAETRNRYYNELSVILYARNFDGISPLYAGRKHVETPDFTAWNYNGVLVNIMIRNRFTVHRNWSNMNVHIAFPVDGWWYLVHHDQMEKLVDPVIFETDWFARDGWYSNGSPGQELLRRLREYRIGRIAVTLP